jgi:hypothetical protein
MLFIGTKTELQEISFDKNHPEFHVEKISGEFLPVKHAFKNPFIYFVGTSRGCSCDLGLKSNQRDRDTLEQVAPIQNVLNTVRKISGTYKEWEKKHQSKVENLSNEQANYLNQTLKLIEIIKQEIQKGNSVELYCTWTGDYAAEPEFHEVIDTKQKDIRIDFEIAEKEFVNLL